MEQMKTWTYEYPITWNGESLKGRCRSLKTVASIASERGWKPWDAALSTVEEWKEASRARSTSSAVIGSCFSSTATRSCSSSLSSSSSSEAMSEAPPQHRPRWSCTSVSSTLFNFYPNSKKKSQMPLWSLSRALCALLVHSKLLLKAKLSIWGLTQDSPRSHS